ncbi:MAG: hypothetical protein HY908_23745 [Myxococcales bacterium]|nr:hypothetical protein [Myxococcales bacterium]
MLCLGLLAWPALGHAGEPSPPSDTPAPATRLLDYVTSVRPALVASAEAQPTAGTLLALGRADAAHGLVRAAAVTCRRALRLANEAGDEPVANEAFACVAGAEARVAHVVIKGAPPDTVVSMGDAPSAPLADVYDVDPGTVLVGVSIGGTPLEPAVLTLGDGEERVLDVTTLRPLQVPRPPRPPVALATRPIMLPAGAVAVEGSLFFSLVRVVVPGEPMALPPPSDEPANRLGGGFSLALRGAVADGWELGAAETFVTYVPTDLVLEVGARLLEGDFALRLDLAGRLPVAYFPSVGGYAALRAAGQIEGVLRLEGSLGVGAVKGLRGTFGGEASAGLVRPAEPAMPDVAFVRPGLALEATVSATSAFYLLADAGLGMRDFTVPSSLFLPLGFGLGATVPLDDAPLMDLELRVSWPYLLLPVRGDATSLPPHTARSVVPDCWWLTVGFESYFGLGG